MLHMKKKALLAVLFGLFVIMGAISASLVASGPAAVFTSDDHKVTICHAVAADSGGNQHNGYDIISVDKDSIAGGHDGHNNVGGSNRSDIIPSFPAGSHANKTWAAYPGKGNASLIGSGCGEVVVTTTTVPTTTIEPKSTFTAGAVCDEQTHLYNVSGEVDGEPASVDPETIPGDKNGNTLVDVFIGENEGQVIVHTSGTCIPVITNRSGDYDYYNLPGWSAAQRWTRRSAGE